MTRKLIVFFQPVSGAPLPLAPESIAGELRSIFPADFAIEGRVLGDLPAPAAGVDRAFLHDALAAFTASEDAKGPDWKAHVVLAGRYEDQHDALGVMSEPARRGCAVFTEAASAWDVFVRTVAHELGHVLNLDHKDAARRCVMTDPLPSDLNLSFSDVGEHHLLAHPDELVGPGCRPFGDCVQAGDDPVSPHAYPREGARFSTPRRRARTAAQLSASIERGVVLPDRPTPTLIVGEPVFVTVRLRNTDSRRPLSIAGGSHGGMDVVVEVERDGVGWERLHPDFRACAKPIRLAPRETLVQREQILFRHGRLIADSPGGLRVRASVRLASGSFVVSPTLAFEIAAPATARHKRQIRLILESGLGRALELGSTSRFGGAQIGLESLRDQRGFRKHPLRAWARLVLASDTAREFLASGRRGARADALRALGHVARDPRAPAVAKQEALVWRARIIERDGFHAATQIYERAAELESHHHGIRSQVARALDERKRQAGRRES